jgi:hypothetical protein
MAIVTRYFTTPAATWVTSTAYVVGDYVLGTDNLNYRCILGHTSAAGDRPITGGSYTTYWEVCDGTTWNKRANLLPAGNWSAVITGFNFGGSDSLTCLIEGGLSYTCSQTLNTTTITTDPTAQNQLLLRACDSSGTPWTPPDPDWTSDQPPWSTSGMPTIATTTDVATISLYYCRAYGIVFTATATTSVFMIQDILAMEWCVVRSSSTATMMGGMVSRTIQNCFLEYTGTIFNTAYVAAGNDMLVNVRFKGVGGGSGNRIAVSGPDNDATALDIVGCTIISFVTGVDISDGLTNQCVRMSRSVIYGCSGTGFDASATASQFRMFSVLGCVIVGNTGSGIDARSSLPNVTNCRLRDNTAGNFTNFANFATDINNVTSAGTDGDEFVDAAGGDYRIKNSSSIWGRNVGVSDQPAAGGSTRGYIIGG